MSTISLRRAFQHLSFEWSTGSRERFRVHPVWSAEPKAWKEKWAREVHSYCNSYSNHEGRICIPALASMSIIILWLSVLLVSLKIIPFWLNSSRIESATSNSRDFLAALFYESINHEPYIRLMNRKDNNVVVAWAVTLIHGNGFPSALQLFFLSSTYTSVLQIFEYFVSFVETAVYFLFCSSFFSIPR